MLNALLVVAYVILIQLCYSSREDDKKHASFTRDDTTGVSFRPVQGSGPHSFSLFQAYGVHPIEAPMHQFQPVWKS